jgi:hypothetical protein
MSEITRRATVVAACLAVTATFAVGCSKTQEATKGAVSSATSAASSAASAVSSAATSAATAAAGTTTLYYPDQETAMFSIVAPDSWKVSKIDQVGDFGSLESADGSVLQFRAQKFDSDDQTKKEIDAIADSTKDFLKENYTDIQLDDPKDITVDGQPGLQLAGTGKDKAGNAVKFLSAMIFLGPQSLAEIWAAVFPEGNNDLDVASTVLDSFKLSKPQ